MRLMRFVPILLIAVSAMPNRVIARDLPTLRIGLASGIRPESVHINYFMSGTFGGYGSYEKEPTSPAAYLIHASVEGKPAENIKVIAYIPGCQIATFDVSFKERPDVERTLSCEPLPTLSVVMKIESKPIREHAEVAIRYLASWDHPFFGITDGMVTAIQINTAHPDAEGRFKVDLPDFSKDPTIKRYHGHEQGEFMLILRDPQSLNHYCSLGIQTEKGFRNLTVQPSYSPEIVVACQPGTQTN